MIDGGFSNYIFEIFDKIFCKRFCTILVTNYAAVGTFPNATWNLIL